MPIAATGLAPRRGALGHSQVKRMLDLCAVLALAPLAVPLVAVLWALVRIGSPGPGFYGDRKSVV